MRAPLPSFRSEIDDVRTWAAEQPDDAFRPRLLAMLERWRDHPDVNQMWAKIAKAATAGGQLPLGAREFVGCIIRLWIAANETKRMVDGSPDLESKLRAQADRAFKDDLVAEAAIKKAAAIAFRDKREQLLGRKQAEAYLQQFKTQCSELLKNNCGKPLDDVVATLTEIVFDCGPVSIESVRGARKNRDIRPPK